MYISFFDAQIQLFSFVIGIRSIHISFFFLEKEKARWIKISQGFDFSRGRMMERIKRRLRALEDSADSGPLKRTLHLALEDMHLRFEVALFRTFIRVVSLPGGEAHTQARAYTYTHWPTRYVLAPSEIVSGYSRQTLGLFLSPFLFDGQPFLARSTSFWILNWYLVSQSFSTRTITSRYLRFLVELVVTCDANLLVTIYLVS